jgi:hypothetical protein
VCAASELIFAVTRTKLSELTGPHDTITMKLLRHIAMKVKERGLKWRIDNSPADDSASRKALAQHLLKHAEPIRPDGHYIPYVFDDMKWVLPEVAPVYALPASLPSLTSGPGCTLSEEPGADAMQKWQHKQLRQRLPVGMGTDDAGLFDTWSKCLARHLNRPRATVRADLFYLYNGYKNQDAEYCLKLVNSFHEFPGYPFMASGSFSQHMNFACQYLKHAAQRKPRVPSIPFIAFSKTASAYISTTLAHILQLPETVLSYQHQTGIPAWVRSFARFGGITHDHYQPTPANLSLLRNLGIKRCIIHRRHPVTTMISHAFHFINLDAANRSVHHHEQLALAGGWLDRELEGMLRRYATWWRNWRHEAAEGKIEMLPTRYEDMVDDPVGFFQRLLAFYGFTTFSDSAVKLMLDKVGYGSQNFRRADPDEWKEILKPSQIETLRRFTAQEFEDYSF